MPGDMPGETSRSGQAASYQRAAIERFLGTLPQGSPLPVVVSGTDVQRALADFESADTQALVAQARYRNWSWRGLAATTFGVLIGALLLFPVDNIVAGRPREVIGAVQTLALLLTSVATLIISWLKPLDEWRADRGRAEDLRGRIFETILRAPVPAGASAETVAAQKLDLVLSAFVDDQLGYFDKRAAEHARLASKFSPVRLLAYVLIIIAFLLGAVAFLQALGPAVPEGLSRVMDWLKVPEASRWQLGLTTIASGILAHALSRTLIDEDERKAKLYQVTGARLRALLKGRLPDAKAAAARGQEAPTQALFAKARTILEREHAVWSFLRSTEGDPDADAP